MLTLGIILISFPNTLHLHCNAIFNTIPNVCLRNYTHIVPKHVKFTLHGNFKQCSECWPQVLCSYRSQTRYIYIARQFYTVLRMFALVIILILFPNTLHLHCQAILNSGPNVYLRFYAHIVPKHVTFTFKGNSKQQLVFRMFAQVDNSYRSQTRCIYITKQF